MAKTVQLTFDAHDPERLGLFWCEALGYVVDPPPGAEIADSATNLQAWDDFVATHGIVNDNSRFAVIDPQRQGPRLFFQKVDEPKAAKNRVHLDVRNAVGLIEDERMAALEAEAERLVAVGATRVQRFEPGPIDNGWIVMADPEGNEFCLD